LLEGRYHSVFKGSGLAFEEVRAYQPGDDVRTIDWNVTARLGVPFIKRFVEEREQTVVLALDASGSLQFGTHQRDVATPIISKRQIATELAALLAYSAVGNGDRVGLVIGSDRIERDLPATRNTRSILRLLRDVLFYEPTHRGTSLTTLLDHIARTLRRRTVVFLLSDFLDTGYESTLRRVGRQHDVIAVHLTDPREEQLPNVGLMQLRDAETDQPFLIDTSSSALRSQFAERAEARRSAVRLITRAAQVDLLEISTATDHIDALVRFFAQREQRRKGRR